MAAALVKAERIQAFFLSGFSAQQPAPPHSAAYAAPAAQQSRAPTHPTTSVTSAARQPPASANLATLFAPPHPTAYGSGRLHGSNCCRRGASARFHRSCPNQASGTPCRHPCDSAHHATAGSPGIPRPSELHTLVGRGLVAPSPTPTATALHDTECSLPRATSFKIYVPQQRFSIRPPGPHQGPLDGST